MESRLRRCDRTHQPRRSASKTCATGRAGSWTTSCGSA